MKNMKLSESAVRGVCHGITTLGERGQLVIPLEVRKKLKLKQKDKLFVFSRLNKVVVLVKANELQNLLNLLVPEGMPLAKSTKRAKK